MIPKHRARAWQNCIYSALFVIAGGGLAWVKVDAIVIDFVSLLAGVLAASAGHEIARAKGYGMRQSFPGALGLVIIAGAPRLLVLADAKNPSAWGVYAYSATAIIALFGVVSLSLLAEREWRPAS